MKHLRQPAPSSMLALAKTLRLTACWLAPLIVGAIVPGQSTLADEAYLPFVEPLQVAQKRAYVLAAPKGQDEPLPEPTETLEATFFPAAPMAASRLEQMAEEKTRAITLDDKQQDQVLHEDLEQFGYDIFNRVPSTFSQVNGIPVPPNYRIGPGDNIIVQLFGKINVEYNLVVTRDGNILVPEYGPVKVSGLTFDEAERLLTEGFERRIIGAKAVVTMGQLRTIQIRLAGDVVQPGVYTVGGLSTLIDAMLATGGVKPSGSLRRMELIRGGEVIAKLDLYDLLLRGRSDHDVYLAHNDTIFIPPIGPIVYVGGKVQRPAIYELLGGETVGQVIAMAGGLLPTASLPHSHIERIQASGTRTLLDFSRIGGDGKEEAVLATPVQTGDLLRILPLEDELDQVILLSGHVRRPGGYQFHKGMRVSAIIPSVDELLPGADVDFMLIKRENPKTLRTEIVYVDLIEALNKPGGAQDIRLRSRDQLMIFNLADSREQLLAGIVRELDVQGTDYRPAHVVETRGAVRFTGRLPLQEHGRLLDVLALSGGLRPGGELYYGIIARTRHPGRDIRVMNFSVAAALADPAGDGNPAIEPGDRLYFFNDRDNRSELLAQELERLRLQASYGSEEKLVSILGEVQHAGTYPLTSGMRASDLLCAARGLTRKAYGLGAQLSRIQGNRGADNTMEHIDLASEDLLQLCEYTKEAIRYSNFSTATGGLYGRYLDPQINPILQPMDQVVFTEKSGWVERATVTLSGEVQHPGMYAIDRGETLCQVMERAGGVTTEAYSFGAQFTRRSVRQMQQQTLDELHDQLDDLMVDLSLSHGFNKGEKSPAEWSADKQDYMKTIRSLERAQATGRMVINLEEVMACRAKSDLVLEDGDTLTVPRTPDYVQVAGQVYVPTSHLFSDNRSISDYIELSGGSTVLGRIGDAYVIQANGEVLNASSSRRSSRIARKSVMPGAKIYVPLDVDRMNTTETAQVWVDTLVRSAILAGIVL